VPAQESAGEHRHVTEMFCDLVDSTGIAARLDAEEWRDLVEAYLDAALRRGRQEAGRRAISPTAPTTTRPELVGGCLF
jgi:class 3 adenylate cyclase